MKPDSNRTDIYDDINLIQSIISLNSARGRFGRVCAKFHHKSVVYRVTWDIMLHSAQTRLRVTLFS